MIEENDFCLQFIKENITRVIDGEISLSDFYLSFKSWYSELYSNSKVPNKNDIKILMVKKWGELAGNKWKGWRPKIIDEHEDMTVVLTTA